MRCVCVGKSANVNSALATKFSAENAEGKPPPRPGEIERVRGAVDMRGIPNAVLIDSSCLSRPGSLGPKKVTMPYPTSRHAAHGKNVHIVDRHFKLFIT